jgi:hypothetical protein
MTVLPAYEPNQIIWENLSFSSGSSGWRKTIMKLAAVFIGLFSILCAIALDG